MGTVISIRDTNRLLAAGDFLYLYRLGVRGEFGSLGFRCGSKGEGTAVLPVFWEHERNIKVLEYNSLYLAEGQK